MPLLTDTGTTQRIVITDRILCWAAAVHELCCVVAVISGECATVPVSTAVYCAASVVRHCTSDKHHSSVYIV